MRSSCWCSDVCSSDLEHPGRFIADKPEQAAELEILIFRNGSDIGVFRDLCMTVDPGDDPFFHCPEGGIGRINYFPSIERASVKTRNGCILRYNIYHRQGKQQGGKSYTINIGREWVRAGGWQLV